MAEKASDNFNWTASEYVDHQKGASWYLVLIVATALLAGLVYIWIGDYFATGIIIVMGIVVGTVARWKPRQVEYQLSSDGITVAEKFYPYSEFRNFFIAREGDLTSLVFAPIKRFMPPLSVYFDDADEDEIVSIIGDHLPMAAEQKVNRVDRLTHRLRF